MERNMSHKNAGYLVKTKDGKKGRTKHSDEPVIVYKVPVYLDDGTKMLCDRSTLKITGYID